MYPQLTLMLMFDFTTHYCNARCYQLWRLAPVVSCYRNQFQARAEFRGGGRRAGGAQRNFIWGGSAPMSDPLPCYKPFLTGKVAIWYTFH